jgi:translation initiation factor 5
MSTLNINGDTTDPYYRYTMPLLISSKAGKGNGCFTIIDNLQSVTGSFNHPASIVFKYMGSVLGSNTTESKWSMTGHYDDERLIEVLYQYINSFVMCPNCNIPELLPSVDGKKKNKKLILTCSACGKSETKSHTCKEELKGIDLILKHLENNVWTIKKGSMVEQIDTFDPFTHMLK